MTVVIELFKTQTPVKKASLTKSVQFYKKENFI